VPQGVEFRVNSTTAHSQDSPAVAMDENGDFIIAWNSFNDGPNSYDVYAQRYAVTDALPPSVVSGAVAFQVSQAVSLTFSEPLDPATVSATDLSALNLDNGATPVATSVAISSGNTVATWTFGTAVSSISDGD
jgi:hypothetical protein